MAELTKSFIKVNADSGTGNATLTVTATSAHTGREARSTTITIKTAGNVSKDVTVSQSPRAAHITLVPVQGVAAAGGTITVSGTANVRTIFKGQTSGNYLNPTSMTCNNAACDFGFGPSGDVGKAISYPVTLSVTVPANTTAKTRRFMVQLYDRAKLVQGTTIVGQAVITQLAAGSTLSVDKTSLSIGQTGGSGTIAVTSNDDWTVS